MTIEQWLTAQKASVDPAKQTTAPALQWFTGALDEEQNRAKILAANGWPYIQYIQGDEAITTRTHTGEAVYNCPSYFNIFHGVLDGSTPDELESILWFDLLSSLPTFYRAWGIDELGQTYTAQLVAIEKPNATNRRPRKVQHGLLMATVYANLMIFRP
jgi:hypothetical protein